LYSTVRWSRIWIFSIAPSGRYPLRECFADLGRHGVAYTFFLAALSGMWPVRISERYSHGDASPSFAGEDGDLALGRSE
jgi:hypothetical protein